MERDDKDNEDIRYRIREIEHEREIAQIQFQTEVALITDLMTQLKEEMSRLHRNTERITGLVSDNTLVQAKLAELERRLHEAVALSAEMNEARKRDNRALEVLLAASRKEIDDIENKVRDHHSEHSIHTAETTGASKAKEAMFVTLKSGVEILTALFALVGIVWGAQVTGLLRAIIDLFK